MEFKQQHDLTDWQKQFEQCKQQAEIWAQEARSYRSTVREIYQIISGGKGEPGTWNGTNPVRAYVAARDEEARVLRRALEMCEQQYADTTGMTLRPISYYIEAAREGEA